MAGNLPGMLVNLSKPVLLLSSNPDKINQAGCDFTHTVKNNCFQTT
jgi:hypothetical protein